MAPISPSTLVFAFCLTRELQIVVGTPTPWAQHQARNTRIIVENEETARPLCAGGSGGDLHLLLFSVTFVRASFPNPVEKVVPQPCGEWTSVFVLALSFVSQTFPSWESMKLCLPLDQPQLPHETCSARARAHLCARWLEEHALMKSTPLSRGDSQDLPMRKFRSRLLASRAVSDL